jgi:hypothetical protein
MTEEWCNESIFLVTWVQRSHLIDVLFFSNLLETRY